jgi:hypothetical protein
MRFSIGWVMAGLLMTGSAQAGLLKKMQMTCIVQDFNDKKVALDCGTSKDEHFSILRSAIPASKDDVLKPGKPITLSLTLDELAQALVYEAPRGNDR